MPLPEPPQEVNRDFNLQLAVKVNNNPSHSQGISLSELATAGFCFMEIVEYATNQYSTRVSLNRERVQEMLGGISEPHSTANVSSGEQTGTPFPKEVTELHPLQKEGLFFRYVEVIQFCKDKGLIADAQSSTF